MNIIKKENVSKTTWVQTERKTHEAWAALIHQSPKAAALMHILTSRIGENNAVVVSHKVLAQLMMVKSITTVKQAIKILESGNWIEIRQVGDRGTVNAYVLNDRVAWTQPRDNLRYSLFSATVVTSSDEQPDKDQLGNQEPLRKLPKVGELQMPYGDGLPPPSQPFLPDMETNLPATSHTLELEFESEKERNGAEKLLQMYFDSIRSRGDGYSETDSMIDEELLNMPDPYISDDD